MANEKALGLPVRKRIGEGPTGNCDAGKVMRLLEERKQNLHDILQPMDI